MFLPQFYENDIDEYLKDVNECLHDNSWIFNFQITNFIGCRVWEKMPVEWRHSLLNLSTEELNQLPYQFCKEDWPESLKSFLRLAHRLSLPRKRCEEYPAIEIAKVIKRGMIPKKMAEVSSLAAVVNEVCRTGCCAGVVDVGAGLGYLGQVLTLQLGHDVIGLELKDNHTKGAEQRQTKQGGKSKSKLYTMELKDDQKSRDNLRKILQMESTDTSTLNAGSYSPSSRGVLSDEDSCQCRKNSDSSCFFSSEKTGSSCRKSMEPNQSSCVSESTGCSQICRTCGKNDIFDISGDLKEASSHFDECSSVTGKTSNEMAEGDSSSERKMSNCSESGSETVVASKNSDIGCRNLSCCDGIVKSGGFCVVGLHSCGDLTPTMLKMFCDIEELSHLVCVSCCYHNMERTIDDVFINFPMSQKVQDAVSPCNAPWWNQYAFRLAAQETRARWRLQMSQDHQQHTRHVAYRSLLQEFVNKGESRLKKIRRKVARKSAFDDFESYLDAVLERVEGVDISSQRQELVKLYKENEEYFKYIEPITGLQVVLQPVIETLITVDRALYLRERGFKADIVPIFDEFVSPRNLAIISKKM